MLTKIPQTRLLSYFVLLCLTPAIVVAFIIWQKIQEVDLLEMRMEKIHSTALLYDAKQAANSAIIQHYSKSDPSYIDKYLEKLHFLEPEVDELQKVLSNKKFPDNEEAKRRLEFITGPGNTLTFNEGAVVRYPLFREVVEMQVAPVEVNFKDIQKILALTEGVPLNSFEIPPGRPQLIILDFRIDKKKIGEENEVFSLNARLLKREYL